MLRVCALSSFSLTPIAVIGNELQLVLYFISGISKDHRSAGEGTQARKGCGKCNFLSIAIRKEYYRVSWLFKVCFRWRSWCFDCIALYFLYWSIACRTEDIFFVTPLSSKNHLIYLDSCWQPHGKRDFLSSWEWRWHQSQFDDSKPEAWGGL